MTITTLPATFADQTLDIIIIGNERWIRGPQIGAALGYGYFPAKAVRQLYQRHRAEFDTSDTMVVELPSSGGMQLIPARGTGVYLTRETIEQCMTLDDPVIRFDAPQNFEQYDEAVIETVLDAWWQEHVQPALDRLLPRRPCYIGQDFARVGDLTVIAIGQRSLTLMPRRSAW